MLYNNIACQTKELVSISISPSSKLYKSSDSFYKSSYTVTAHYSDGGSKNVTQASSFKKDGRNISDGDLVSSGTTLTASYTEKGVTKTADCKLDVRMAYKLRNGIATLYVSGKIWRPSENHYSTIYGYIHCYNNDLYCYNGEDISGSFSDVGVENGQFSANYEGISAESSVSVNYAICTSAICSTSENEIKFQFVVNTELGNVNFSVNQNREFYQ